MQHNPSTLQAFDSEYNAVVYLTKDLKAQHKAPHFLLCNPKKDFPVDLSAGLWHLH